MPALSKVAPFDALLGKIPDTQLGRLIGVSADAVRLRRLKLNIDRYVPPGGLGGGAFDHLMWYLPDAQIAILANVSRHAIQHRRKRLGIAPPKRAKRLAEWEPFLGQITDQALAEIAGVSKQNVTAFRRRRGIASYRERNQRAAVSFSYARGRRPAKATSGTAQGQWGAGPHHATPTGNGARTPGFHVHQPCHARQHRPWWRALGAAQGEKIPRNSLILHSELRLGVVHFLKEN
ncbi:MULTISPECIES: hypothetical protein [unclassified Brenneria]|uniref:hypothetical protein n=1 Tax=unclassified Brenneria TaxID=2634434 RepID=UPI0018F08582|nr:hypothetical protein [Brenneria sp. L3-3C-1]MBJ7223489.1 hypothetical protein [Brenneria sp. L3-3C-1]MEE3644729.1 hypothetical protein [Brenneria sp. L3_3C_1]